MRRFRMQLPASRPGSAALRLPQQDEAVLEGDAHLLTTYGWKIEGNKAIVDHGGRWPISLLGRKETFKTNSYTMTMGYDMTTNPKSCPP